LDDYNIEILEERNELEDLSDGSAYLKIKISADWTESTAIYEIEFAKAIILESTKSQSGGLVPSDPPDVFWIDSEGTLDKMLKNGDEENK
jgi:hypothetical protein